MCCHADSLAARISCNFLLAASRLARIALSCSSNLARASALACSLFALSLSTSASHFLICDSIIAVFIFLAHGETPMVTPHAIARQTIGVESAVVTDRQSSIDAIGTLLAQRLLRRYVTYCARRLSF